jgi:hypothetical protein
VPGVKSFSSLEAAMQAGFEPYDHPRIGQNYWLVRAPTCKGWALAVAVEAVAETIRR